MNADQIAQLPGWLFDLLTDLVIHVTPGLKEGDEQDEVDASRTVDSFLEQYEPDPESPE